MVKNEKISNFFHKCKPHVAIPLVFATAVGGYYLSNLVQKSNLPNTNNSLESKIDSQESTNSTKTKEKYLPRLYSENASATGNDEGLLYFAIDADASDREVGSSLYRNPESMDLVIVYDPREVPGEDLELSDFVEGIVNHQPLNFKKEIGKDYWKRGVKIFYSPGSNIELVKENLRSLGVGEGFLSKMYEMTPEEFGPYAKPRAASSDTIAMESMLARTRSYKPN